MKISLLFFSLLFATACFCQTVEMEIFTTSTNPANSKVGFRLRTTSGSIQYQGLTFYLLFQSANASFASVDDAKLVSGFGWGVGTKFTNTQDLSTAPATPIVVGNQTYDRRYIYGNADETGSNIKTLTTAWDTLLYITFNNLQASFPQGGTVYAQETGEAPAVALTDINFSNVSLDVINNGPLALGSSDIPPVTPVRFTRFAAQCGPDGTSITWGTASETNNSHFEVQKSSDGSSWTTITSIAPSSANSNSAKSYGYTDKAGGAAQYRIKQVDLNGATAYTDIVRTTCNSKSVFVSLYPVPARDKLTLVIGSDKAVRTTLHVMDNNGRVVMTVPVVISKGVNNIPLNTSGLSQGQYYIRASNDGVDLNERFVVSR